ncbi:hypothetical protein BKA69DRAFT_287393 [Paraphysoderma sedebokerense]|nr:hypothetical protein BKA69DRAFT_287393 [Paraphysoderma sedebokerense]
MKEAQRRQVEAVAASSDTTYEEYLKSHTNCLHITAILRYSSLMNYLNSAARDVTDTGDFVDSITPITAVCFDSDSETYGIVRKKSREITCVSCKYNPRHCKHVMAMDRYLLTNEISREDLFGAERADCSFRDQGVCVSWKKLPIMNQGGFRISNHVRDGSFLLLIPPVDGECSCGSLWSDADPVEQDWIRERCGRLLIHCSGK